MKTVARIPHEVGGLNLLAAELGVGPAEDRAEIVDLVPQRPWQRAQQQGQCQKCNEEQQELRQGKEDAHCAKGMRQQ